MKKTEAFLKVEAERDQRNRGRTKLESATGKVVAYCYIDISGRPAAVVYSGRRRKPDCRHWYKSSESRERHIRQLFSAAESEPEKVARQLVIGDVLAATWGYEQTNVDFYQVIELVGKRSVMLCKIASDYEPEGDMQGKRTPLPDSFIGDAIVKRVCRRTGVSVNLGDFQLATKVVPLEVIDGVPRFRAHRVSSYA